MYLCTVHVYSSIFINKMPFLKKPYVNSDSSDQPLLATHAVKQVSHAMAHYVMHVYLQVKWVSLSSRTVLVLTSIKGIQVKM